MILFPLIIIGIEFLFVLILKLYISKVTILKLFSVIPLGLIILYIIKKDFKNTVVNRYPFRYGIFTYKDHMINIFFIMLYFFIFIIGILWLRFHNQGKIFDIISYKNKLWEIILNANIFDIILSTIIIFIIFIYIIILIRLNYYFKFQLIRRHLFHLRLDAPEGAKKSKYEEILTYLKNHLNLNEFWGFFGSKK